MVYLRSQACRLLRGTVIIFLLWQGCVLSPNVADFAILCSGNRGFVWCYGKAVARSEVHWVYLTFYLHFHMLVLSEMLELYLWRMNKWFLCFLECTFETCTCKIVINILPFSRGHGLVLQILIQLWRKP